MSACQDASNWKNVNNWHWIEKDCTSWAHDRLREMLVLVTVEVEGRKVAVNKVENVSGDVSVNVRKGRIRQIFDLTMELVLGDGEEDLPAKITDYMSDTDYAGFEFRCSRLSAPTREIMKKAIWEQLEGFKDKVEKVHGKSLLVEGASETSDPAASKKKFDGVFADDKAAEEGERGSFEDKVNFNVPAEAVWAALTEPQQIMAWTRGSARVSSVQTGATLTLLNGNVIIKVLESSAPNKILKMNWSLKHWPSGCESTVTIGIKDGGHGSCTLKLEQGGIPVGEVASVKDNWHRYYWEPIKTILGCTGGASVVF